MTEPLYGPARALAEGAANFVTWKQFGAVGDGVADDAAAINACMLYAKENGLEARATTPSVGYLITQPIDIYDNTRLYGESGARTMVICRRSDGLTMADSPGEAAGPARTVGWRVARLLFVGDDDTATDGDDHIGLHAARAYQFRVDECEFRGFSYGVVIDGRKGPNGAFGAADGRFTDCIFGTDGAKPQVNATNAYPKHLIEVRAEADGVGGPDGISFHNCRAYGEIQTESKEFAGDGATTVFDYGEIRSDVTPAKVLTEKAHLAAEYVSAVNGSRQALTEGVDFAVTAAGVHEPEVDFGQGANPLGAPARLELLAETGDGATKAFRLNGRPSHGSSETGRAVAVSVGGAPVAAGGAYYVVDANKKAFAFTASDDELSIGTTNIRELLKADGVTPAKGRIVRVSAGGALPANLSAGVDYFATAIDVGAGTFKLAASYADAVAGSPAYVELGDPGSGDRTVEIQHAIEFAAAPAAAAAIVVDDLNLRLRWIDPNAEACVKLCRGAQRIGFFSCLFGGGKTGIDFDHARRCTVSDANFRIHEYGVRFGVDAGENQILGFSARTDATIIHDFAKDESSDATNAYDAFIAKGSTVREALYFADSFGQSSGDRPYVNWRDDVLATNVPKAGSSYRFALAGQPVYDYDIGQDAHRFWNRAGDLLGRISGGGLSLGSSDAVVAQMTVATRTQLKALPTSEYGGVYLTEAGREGYFVFKSQDLSTQVAADQNEGVYVRANDTAAASGAWMRAFDGPLNVKWFGVLGDDATDDRDAIEQAIKTVATYPFGGRLYFPRGAYLVDGKVRLKSNVHLVAETRGGVTIRCPDGAGSRIVFEVGAADAGYDYGPGTATPLAPDYPDPGDRAYRAGAYAFATDGVHGLSDGDFVRFVSQRSALSADAGDRRVGFPTGFAQQTYFGEIRRVVGTGLTSTEFRTDQGLVFDDYNTDLADETGFDASADHTTETFDVGPAAVRFVGSNSNGTGCVPVQIKGSVQPSGVSAGVKYWATNFTADTVAFDDATATLTLGTAGNAALWSAGDPIRIWTNGGIDPSRATPSTGRLPTGVNWYRDYYVGNINVGAGTFQLFETAADAIAGAAPVTFADDAAGAHTVRLGGFQIATSQALGDAGANDVAFTTNGSDVRAYFDTSRERATVQKLNLIENVVIRGFDFDVDADMRGGVIALKYAAQAIVENCRFVSRDAACIGVKVEDSLECEVRDCASTFGDEIDVSGDKTRLAYVKLISSQNCALRGGVIRGGSQAVDMTADQDGVIGFGHTVEGLRLTGFKQTGITSHGNNFALNIRNNYFESDGPQAITNRSPGTNISGNTAICTLPKSAPSSNANQYAFGITEGWATDCNIAGNQALGGWYAGYVVQDGGSADPNECFGRIGAKFVDNIANGCRFGIYINKFEVVSRKDVLSELIIATNNLRNIEDTFIYVEGPTPGVDILFNKLAERGSGAGGKGIRLAANSHPNSRVIGNDIHNIGLDAVAIYIEGPDGATPFSYDTDKTCQVWGNSVTGTNANAVQATRGAVTGFVVSSGQVGSKQTDQNLAAMRFIADDLSIALAGDAFTVSNAASGEVEVGVEAIENYRFGDRVWVATDGTLPAPLAGLMDYVVFDVDAANGRFRLARTMPDAIAGTSLALSSSGAGVHTIGAPNRYTPGLLFGTNDDDKTTLNPYTGAGVVAYAGESFSADTSAAMGLQLLVSPPGSAENVLFPGVDVTPEGSLKVANRLHVANDLLYSDYRSTAADATNGVFKLLAETLDGGDRLRAMISGGGDAGVARGAYLDLAGNEHDSAGNALLTAGDVSAATLTLAAPASDGAVVMQVDGVQAARAVSGSLIVGTAAAAGDPLYVSGGSLQVDHSEGINGRNGNSNTWVDIDMPEITTAAGALRLFKDTNTTGDVSLIGQKGDGSGDAGFRLSGNGVENSYVCRQGGNFGVATGADPDYPLHVAGAIGLAPGASVTPVNNGDVVFEATDDTTVTIKLKGSDGTVRSGTVALS